MDSIFIFPFEPLKKFPSETLPSKNVGVTNCIELPLITAVSVLISILLPLNFKCPPLPTAENNGVEPPATPRNTPISPKALSTRATLGCKLINGLLLFPRIRASPPVPKDIEACVDDNSSAVVSNSNLSVFISTPPPVVNFIKLSEPSPT